MYLVIILAYVLAQLIAWLFVRNATKKKGSKYYE